MQEVPVGMLLEGVQLPMGSILKGRYIVEDLLGRGGFGAVYLVRDLRVKGNLFALKEVVDPDRKERERFIFESEVLKRLEHRALPRVYRVFDDDRYQRAYMLMDYIEGSNLEAQRQYQPGKRFPLSQVLAMMEPIMDAISYLHKQHPPIIHRDIKPSNIIAPAPGEEAVLVDFGIAKEYTPDNTTTAIRRCSPGYAAPEQYGIGTCTLTDIYGLGATLYTLLTGIVPADALHRITELNSQRADPLLPVHKLAPDLSPQVAMAIHRALSLNENNRFATVEHFWKTLTAQPGSGQLLTAVIASPAPSTMKPSTPASVPIVSQQQVADAATFVMPSIDLGAQSQKKAAGSRRSMKYGLLVLALLVVLIASGIGVSLWPYASDHPVAHSSLPTTGPRHTASPPVQKARKDAVVPSKTKPTATPQPPVTTTGGSTSQPGGVTTPPPTIPTSQPTSIPKPLPTPRPTSPHPTPTPIIYPNVAGNYTGTIDDTTENIVTGMALSIVQKPGQQSITGYFSVDPALVGSNNFTGSINTKKYIQFTVQSYKGNAPLYFWGWVQSNGSMKGNYCSINSHNSCEASAGDAGTWSVSPPAAGSSYIPDMFHWGISLGNGITNGDEIATIFWAHFMVWVVGSLGLFVLSLLLFGFRRRRRNRPVAAGVGQG